MPEGSGQTPKIAYRDAKLKGMRYTKLIADNSLDKNLDTPSVLLYPRV